jgi:hypothetical protein
MHEFGATISVSCTSLDEFWKSQSRNPALIKVDVEGFELEVLRGATSLLSLSDEFAPAWIIEYIPWNCLEFDYSIEDVWKLLTNYGYGFYVQHEGGRLAKIAAPEFASSATETFDNNLLALRPFHIRS